MFGDVLMFSLVFFILFVFDCFCIFGLCVVLCLCLCVSVW